MSCVNVIIWSPAGKNQHCRKDSCFLCGSSELSAAIWHPRWVRTKLLHRQKGFHGLKFLAFVLLLGINWNQSHKTLTIHLFIVSSMYLNYLSQNSDGLSLPRSFSSLSCQSPHSALVPHTVCLCQSKIASFLLSSFEWQIIHRWQTCIRFSAQSGSCTFSKKDLKKISSFVNNFHPILQVIKKDPTRL